jgi:hypothetical protein
MATRKKSASEEELMTPANISRVIRLLEPQDEGVKPITKKDACQILGMSYNTTRLGTIIEEFKKAQARSAKRRAELRGKPASHEDIVYIITEYLNGETVDGISKMTYRSPTFIKNLLETHAVPMRVPGHSYFNPQLIPDGAVRDRFKVGEVVYSSRYDSTARIDAERENHPVHGWVYAIYLLSDKWLQSAYQPASELASLQHLRDLGVRI